MPPAPEPPRPFLWGAYPNGFRPGELVDWTDDAGEVREGRYRVPLARAKAGTSTVWVEDEEGSRLVTLPDDRIHTRQELDLRRP